MNGTLVTIVLAVVVPLLVNEASDVAPWLAGRLVRWGARHLGPHADIERYEEEWSADLERVPGKLTKLAHACLVVGWSVPRMRRQFSPRRWLTRWKRWRWNRTIERWTPVVWHVVRARGLSRAAAEDAVVEVWLRYGRESEETKLPGTEIGRWLVAHAREQVLCAPPGTDPVEEPAEPMTRDARLWRAQCSLPHDDQEVLRLARLTKRRKGWKRTTLEQLLGTSSAEALRRRDAALERLRDRLASAKDRSDTH